jgi:ribonuclease Z
VTDCRFTKENIEKIIALAREADLFFCEAGFLEKDWERAEERAHLTARQAGELGRLANARKLQIFHFSPKYEKEPGALFQEAEEAFQG